MAIHELKAADLVPTRWNLMADLIYDGRVVEVGDERGNVCRAQAHPAGLVLARPGALSPVKWRDI